MEKSRIIAVYGIASIAGLVAISMLYPLAHPFAGLRLSLGKDAIDAAATRIVRSQGYMLAGYSTETSLRMQHDILRGLQKRFGPAGANALARRSVPAYYWDVRWVKASSLNVSFSGIRRTDAGEARRSIDAIEGDIRLRFDTRGDLLSWTVSDRDSLPHPGTRAEAELLVRTFVGRNNSAVFPALFGTNAVAPHIDSTRTMLTGASDAAGALTQQYIFRWMIAAPVRGDSLRVTASVKGAVVSSFAVDYHIDPGFVENDGDITQSLLSGCAILGGIILMIFVGIKRYRSYEIGFRSGLVLGIVAALCFAVNLFLQVPANSGTEVYVAVLIVPPFIALGMLLCWAVSEALGRETDPERFLAFDLASKGYLLDSRFGVSLVRGLSIGILLCVMWLAALVLLPNLVSIAAPMADGDSQPFSSIYSVTPLALLCSQLLSALFIVSMLIVFLYSYLQQKLTRRWVALLLTAALYAAATAKALSMAPYAAGYMISFAHALVLAWIFQRHGLVAALFAAVVAGAALNGAGFFFTEAPAHQSAGMIYLGAYVLLFALGVTGMLTRDTAVGPDHITPAFARHITERQRLQRELEIARTVQMSFLPRTDPAIEGLQIASRCAPAYEVGGDYYDFIRLGPRTLAIAIGDVSGKGTQAAFYMTLTKGFLHALAQQHGSPARVLTEMNRLFYDNVERGTFISMIYAVIDLDDRTIHIARAGHNPAYLKRSGEMVEAIRSKGLALGFEAGEAFATTIEEVCLPLYTGDVFVFYTDGFPEAMSLTREEFGETRLAECIGQTGDATPESMIEQIFAATKLFTGKAEQHDDMTIVIAKIKS